MTNLYIYEGEHDDKSLAVGIGTIPKWAKEGPQPTFEIEKVPASKTISKGRYFIREKANSPPGIKCTLVKAVEMPGKVQTLTFRRDE